MRKQIIALAALALVLGPVAYVQAQDEGEDAPATAAQKHGKKHGKGKGPAVEMKEMTLTGTVVKEEARARGKKDEGAEATAEKKFHYVLVDASGAKVMLPKTAPAKKGGEETAAINLDDYVGAKVTITGMGFTHERKGKTMTRLRKISGIEKAE